MAVERGLADTLIVTELLARLPDAVVLLDGNEVVRFHNARAPQLLGRDVLMGEPLPFVIETKELFDAQLTGPNGAIILEVNSSDLRLSGERMTLVTLRDVTARRKRAAEDEHAQKMEAIGRLAAGVAHDFNNLLTGIIGFAGFLRDDMSTDDPRRRDIEDVLKAADSGVSLAKQLLAFSRRQVVAPQTVNVNSLLKDLRKMLQQVLGEGVELSLELAREAWFIHIDPGQFEQVLMNLATNARDAMPRGGRLRLSTENVSNEQGACIRLLVEDSGLGMEPAVLSRLFQPFFTTKPRSKGAGLGLAMAFGVIHQAGGQICARSTPGEGSTFEISLPRLKAPLPTSVPEPIKADVRGSETLLIVEDDEIVRRAARRSLQRHGYAVLTAADGESALRVHERYGSQIDLAVLDLMMPKMSGQKLAEQLLLQNPKLKLLFLTGHADDVIEAEGLTQGRTPLLQKPFTEVALATRVRQLLDPA